MDEILMGLASQVHTKPNHIIPYLAIPYLAMPYLAIGIRTSTMGREKDICWTGTVVIAIKHIKAIPLIIFIIS